jgi:hypothetical protein
MVAIGRQLTDVGAPVGHDDAGGVLAILLGMTPAVSGRGIEAEMKVFSIVRPPTSGWRAEPST